jgi:hypothetical protein
VRKTILAALVGGLLTLLVAGPASADALGFRDATGDVRVAQLDGDFNLTYKNSSTPNGDVLTSRYEHAGDRVTLYVRYREIYLPRLASGWSFQVVGSNHVVRDVELMASEDAVGGRSVMLNGRGDRVGCKVASRINYATNSVKLVFPRRCLGNPAYIRVGNVSYWYSFSDTRAYVYFDDPSRTGGTVEQVGRAGAWIKAA